MKKTLLAIIALLAGITLIVTLALALTRSPGRYVEGWQTVVDGYIEHKGWTSARKATIAQAVEARTPENFDQETDLHTYANGPYYVVDEPFSRLNGSKPLPYPPEEVWCVLLKRSDGDTPHLIFANYHIDLYNAEWVVHEDGRDPFSQEMQNHLAKLGCDLDLPPQ